MKTNYSTNLTDNQWQVIEKIINPQERARKHSLRDIMDTLHSLVRKLVGRDESPSMGIIDSRSVKTSHYADPSCKGLMNARQSSRFLQQKTESFFGKHGIFWSALVWTICNFDSYPNFLQGCDFQASSSLSGLIHPRNVDAVHGMQHSFQRVLGRSSPGWSQRFFVQTSLTVYVCENLYSYV